ncbi:CHAT domain-containing protein [Microcoleus sp. Pol11C2]|uniref:CHAT domain-containing protein n=1 Tax=Microcoleus sp. Pol11C2 TaxID=3055389 RepID=UPI002FD58DE9
MNQIKILFLASNPVSSTQLKLDQEIRYITQKIRASQHRDSLKLLSAWAVQPDDLLQLFNEHKPDIVHFSGHGSQQGEIILVDKNGRPKAVGIKALKALFSTLKDNIRAVILNACYSELQAKAITEVIDCTIGMNTAIGDTAAITFAASFYRALGFGRSVQESFNQGITALLLEDISEEDTPKLLAKQGVDLAQLFFIKFSASKNVEQFDTVKSEEKRNLSNKVIVDISVMTEDQSLYQSFYGSDTSLNYQVERFKKGILIKKSMEYLSKIEKGDEIEPISYDHVPFTWDFPNLDFKVLNNSPQTIILTEAIFEIEKSWLDPSPVPIIECDSYHMKALHFRIVNEGWGEVKDLKARFHLTPIPPGMGRVNFRDPDVKDLKARFHQTPMQRGMGEVNLTEPYPYEVCVGSFLESFNVNIAEAFRHASITSGAAYVRGELEFKGCNIYGLIQKTIVKFSTIVLARNAEPVIGAPLSPTYQYGTKFQVAGENYKRHVSISHSLKPGKTDRFNIKIGMDKSSYHRFKVKIAYNDGQEILLPDIKMSTFVPRSGIIYMRESMGDKSRLKASGQWDFRQWLKEKWFSR